MDLSDRFTRRANHYNWLLTLIGDGSEVVTLRLTAKGASYLCRISERGELIDELALTGSPAGSQVCPESRRLCLPNSNVGVTLMDLDGYTIATLDRRRLGSPVVGSVSCAFRPGGEEVALGTLGALWLWRPVDDSLSKLDSGAGHLGVAVAWAPDGRTIWYCVGDYQLRACHFSDAGTVVGQIAEVHEGVRRPVGSSWGATPLVSADGRWLHVTLVSHRRLEGHEEEAIEAKYGGTESKKLIEAWKVPAFHWTVLDLQQRTVSCRMGWYAHNTCWLPERPSGLDEL